MNTAPKVSICFIEISGSEEDNTAIEGLATSLPGHLQLKIGRKKFRKDRVIRAAGWLLLKYQLVQAGYDVELLVGLGGGSYGGYVTMMALTHGAKHFNFGSAGASVTDWRLYDSIYTERYMGRPQDNAAGYDATSVIEAADRLHGALLLIHGTMDEHASPKHALEIATNIPSTKLWLA